jgi:D-lactate dehydrogenase
MKILVFDADVSVRDVFATGLSDQTIEYIDAPVSDEALATHADAEILSLFTTSALTAEQIDALPQLKLIVARSTGVDHIALAHAKEKGITVCNVPKYGAHTVAEFSFALILSLSRHIFDGVCQVKEDGNFDTSALEGFDLFGKTLGIVGTGAIGRNVVAIARGFGMRVLMFDKFPNAALAGDNATYVSLDELLAQSDIITLHVPSTPDNLHIIGSEQFVKMKKGVFIINTARGDLIDTNALLEALESGVVAGAGLDVLEGERALHDEMDLVRGNQSINDFKMVIENHVLQRHPKVLITPHVAFFSREAYHEILSTSVADITQFIAGTPQNIVAP